jgi:putative ABC transport system permease protein
VIAAVTAAALLRSSQYMAHVDLGYDAERVVVAPLDISNSEYRSDSAAHLLTDRINADLSHAPGIGAPAIWASIGFAMPKFPGDVMTTAEGSALRMDTRHCNWSNCAFVVHPVTDNLFTTFGVAMTAGRRFDASDRAGNAPVVIINDRAAQLWWPGEDAIGKRIRIGSDASGHPWRTVVGVVANFAPLSGMGLLARAIKTSNIQPMIYEPLAQGDLIGPLPGGEIFVAVRATNAPRATATALQRRLAALIPDIEVPAALSMQEYLLSDYTAAELHLHTLIAVAVTIATLLLAILGIAGVVVESVRYRTRELGVRLALGATRSSIVRLICGSALQWLGAGVVAGIVATLLLDRTIARVVFVSSRSFPNGLLLFGPRHHAEMLVAAAVSVVAVGLAAAYLPARLASRLDPLIALRSGNE